MIFPIFLLNTVLLTLALINYLTMRRPLPAKEIQSAVTVLLPVRNEEENISRVLDQLLNQKDLLHLTVIAINDNSEDRTAELLAKINNPRLVVIDAPPPPAGWIGKVNALQSAFSHPAVKTAHYVVSIDADVNFELDAIARAVRTAEAAKLDFISPYPRQIANTWAERLAQPLLQWSWMSTVLLRGAEKFPMSSTVICNGQFLVMKANSLRAINGFESVAHQVLDDIELGRSFVRAGFIGAVIDGSALAATRMYSDFHQLRAGYGKSLRSAFGGIVGSVIATLFMAATAILPFFAALSGDVIGVAALIAIISTRIISAAASGGRIGDSLLHPLSAILFIYLLYFSWANRGTVQWKGRTV